MRCRFEEFAGSAGEGDTDLITMAAVLHHLDLGGTLARIPRLLAPGGRLLVVGLAKVNSLADAMVDMVSAAANPVVGLVKHPGRAARLTGPRLAGLSCRSAIPPRAWPRSPRPPARACRARRSVAGCSSAIPFGGTSRGDHARRQAKTLG